MCIFLVHLTGQAFVTKYGTIFIRGSGPWIPWSLESWSAASEY